MEPNLNKDKDIPNVYMVERLEPNTKQNLNSEPVSAKVFLLDANLKESDSNLSSNHTSGPGPTMIPNVVSYLEQLEPNVVSQSEQLEPNIVPLMDSSLKI